jgi:NTE family protein
VLALGGGGAPGLAHIGVLQVLAENAIPVRAIVGTSVGAEIGAFIANGMPVSDLADMAIGFDWKQTLQLFMLDLTDGGLSSGINVMKFLSRRLGGVRIENLSIGFAAVATDLETGEQVVPDRGDLIEAVRANINEKERTSISLSTLFSSVAENLSKSLLEPTRPTTQRRQTRLS